MGHGPHIYEFMGGSRRVLLYVQVVTTTIVMRSFKVEITLAMCSLPLCLDSAEEIVGLGGYAEHVSKYR